ncbi:Mrp family chromosome partitioning ATPase [Micromonospora sp. A200]|nr:Mrp family chromosome partitioning ATPase [Micromonospora sp. A200]
MVIGKSLEQSGMIVVIDSPPLLPVTEAAIVAQ